MATTNEILMAALEREVKAAQGKLRTALGEGLKEYNERFSSYNGLPEYQRAHQEEPKLRSTVDTYIARLTEARDYYDQVMEQYQTARHAVVRERSTV